MSYSSAPPLAPSPSLSFREVLYLWPAASQPTSGTSQDEDPTLSCLEAGGEDAPLPSPPKAGGLCSSSAPGQLSDVPFWLGQRDQNERPSVHRHASFPPLV